jgi:hypothetical protein
MILNAINTAAEGQAFWVREDEIIASIKKRLENGEPLYNRATLESLDAQLSDPNWTISIVDSWLEPGKQTIIKRQQE